MLTNARGAFKGQSRSPNSSIPYVMYSFLFLLVWNSVFKTHRFYDIRLQIMLWPEIGVIGHSSHSLVTLSLKFTSLEIFDFKNAMTLKTGLGVRRKSPIFPMTGTLWFAGSLVYSLVALNHTKHHPECNKTHHVQIKKLKKKSGEETAPSQTPHRSASTAPRSSGLPAACSTGLQERPGFLLRPL